MAVEIVFVDWYRTLSTSRFWDHLAHPTEPDHPEHLLFEQLAHSLFVELGSILKPWMRGDLDAEAVCSLVAAHSGVDRHVVLEGLEQSCRNARLVSPEVSDLVRDLRCRGTRVVIATDNMDVFTRWTVPALGLREIFDDILNSADIGCLKDEVNDRGEARFFSAYLAQHAVRPQAALLIDDSDDLRPLIERSGMQFHRVSPTSSIVPALQSVLADTSGSIIQQ